MNTQARLPIRGRLPIKFDAVRASTHSAITLNSDFCTSNKDGVLKVAVGCLVHVLKIRPCDVLRAPPDKGAQDAFVQGGLHMSHDIRIHTSGRVKDDARWWGLIGCISVAISRRFLKHAITCATPETHQAIATTLRRLLNSFHGDMISNCSIIETLRDFQFHNFNPLLRQTP